jgi:hypothetical protein
VVAVRRKRKGEWRSRRGGREESGDCAEKEKKVVVV